MHTGVKSQRGMFVPEPSLFFETAVQEQSLRKRLRLCGRKLKLTLFSLESHKCNESQYCLMSKQFVVKIFVISMSWQSSIVIISPDVDLDLT